MLGWEELVDAHIIKIINHLRAGLQHVGSIQFVRLGHLMPNACVRQTYVKGRPRYVDETLILWRHC